MKLDGLLFWLLLAAHMAAVLSLPVWPSQDGPRHLYYSDVFAALSEDPAAYGGEFEIKHRFPPYALLTYLHIGLAKFASQWEIEKLVVALYVLLLGLAFRYLAKAVGPGARLACLIVFPFVLHSQIFTGLLNFGLATAAMLAAMGVWVRAAGRFSLGRLAAFAGLVVVMLASHPVPLLFSAIVFGAHTVGIVFSQARRDTLPYAAAHNVSTIVAALAPLAALLYVARFTSGGGLQGPVLAPSYVLAQLSDFARLRILMPLAHPVIWTVMALLLVIAAVMAERRLRLCWPSRSWRAGDIVPVAAVFAFCVYLVAPFEMGSGMQFDERFASIAALLLLASAAGTAVSDRLFRPAAVVVSVAAVAVLWISIEAARPQASAVRELAEAPRPAPGARGLILRGPPMEYTFPQGFHYTPCEGAAAHYFRRWQAILADPPWLDLAHIPLGRPAGFDPKLRPVDFILEPVCGPAGHSAPDILEAAQSLGMAPRWRNSSFILYGR